MPLRSLLPPATLSHDRAPAIPHMNASTAIIPLLAIVLAGGAVRTAVPSVHRTFDMHVPVPPAAVVVDGAPRLVYELHLTNFAAAPLVLRGLDVLASPDGAVIAAFPASGLAARTAPIGGTARGTEPPVIAPGSRAVVYLEIDLPRDVVRPTALEHRIIFDRADTVVDAGETVTGARVQVRADAPPVLGAPVRGGPWAVMYHPSWARGHRRVFYVEDGRARIPGRFAVDFFLLDDAGRSQPGDRDIVAEWYGHGAAVLAVADAVVVAARDDVAESPRISTHVRLPFRDATGNYIALDIGGGRYVFYEHLKPGSVRVAEDQRVRRGDVIAEVGFTGHTSGPHLHFHVADANSPLGAEGLPFTLERFEVLGAYGADLAAFGSGPWAPRPADGNAVRTGEMPPPNTVVRFRP